MTSGELFVLKEIQSYWGDQNTANDVFFSNRDEAVLFVRARDGTKPVMVVLTNLAESYETGILSLDEMRDQIKRASSRPNENTAIPGRGSNRMMPVQSGFTSYVPRLCEATSPLNLLLPVPRSRRGDN